MSSCAGVRIAIVGIFVSLATIFTVAEVRSQPRPGGISGVPRPSGISGIGGIPQPPSFPRPPSFTPPKIPAPPSFGGPRFESVWTCGKCKAELGRGNVKPSYDSCPKCGVRFVNGGGGGAGGFGLESPPPPPEFTNPVVPPATGGNPSDPDLLPRSTPSNDPQAFTEPPATPSNDSTARLPSDTKEQPTSKTGSLVLKVMIGVFGLLFLIGILGGVFLIVSANKGSKPIRRSRKLDLDDDDD